MPHKYKLQKTPKCIECKAPTKHFKTLESQFVNQRFISEWYKCTKCEKTQAKVVKVLGGTHGPKISSMA